MQQTSTSTASPVILPAAAEHEWRFSYQFAANPSGLVLRVAVGVGVLALTIVAVNAAW